MLGALKKKNPYAAVDDAVRVFTDAKTNLQTAVGQLEAERDDLRAQAKELAERAEGANAASVRAALVITNIGQLLGE